MALSVFYLATQARKTIPRLIHINFYMNLYLILNYGSSLLKGQRVAGGIQQVHKPQIDLAKALAFRI